MDIRDLKPASQLSQNLGVKSIIYGPPGSAKTPLASTAPRPVMLACEPGLLSLKNSNMPTYLGYTVKEIEAFFAWFFNSTETKNFDTLVVDSISQMCNIYLADAKTKNKHGLQQYGDMAERSLVHLNKIYYQPYKHTYLIAKEDVYTNNGTQIKRPFYPGKELPREIAHLYDCIFHLARVPVPNMGEVLAFRCNGSFDVMARNRMSVLNDFEEPHFGKIIQKCGY